MKMQLVHFISKAGFPEVTLRRSNPVNNDHNNDKDSKKLTTSSSCSGSAARTGTSGREQVDTEQPIEFPHRHSPSTAAATSRATPLAMAAAGATATLGIANLTLPSELSTDRRHRSPCHSVHHHLRWQPSRMALRAQAASENGSAVAGSSSLPGSTMPTPPLSPALHGTTDPTATTTTTPPPPAAAAAATPAATANYISHSSVAREEPETETSPVMRSTFRLLRARSSIFSLQMATATANVTSVKSASAAASTAATATASTVAGGGTDGSVGTSNEHVSPPPSSASRRNSLVASSGNPRKRRPSLRVDTTATAQFQREMLLDTLSEACGGGDLFHCFTPTTLNPLYQRRMSNASTVTRSRRGSELLSPGSSGSSATSPRLRSASEQQIAPLRLGHTPKPMTSVPNLQQQQHQQRLKRCTSSLLATCTSISVPHSPLLHRNEQQQRRMSLATADNEGTPRQALIDRSDTSGLSTPVTTPRRMSCAMLSEEQENEGAEEEKGEAEAANQAENDSGQINNGMLSDGGLHNDALLEETDHVGRSLKHKRKLASNSALQSPDTASNQDPSLQTVHDMTDPEALLHDVLVAAQNIAAPDEWKDICIRLLPLFNDEGVDACMEDVAAAVRRCASRRACDTLRSDLDVFIRAGMFALHSRLAHLEADRLVPEMATLWRCFHSDIVVYIDAVFRSFRHASVRDLLLAGFRDLVLLPLADKLGDAFARFSESNAAASIGREASSILQMCGILLNHARQSTQRPAMLALWQRISAYRPAPMLRTTLC